MRGREERRQRGEGRGVKKRERETSKREAARTSLTALKAVPVASREVSNYGGLRLRENMFTIHFT